MIAAEAGSDKSSIVKYFGSKHGLFREAVRWTIPIHELTDGDPVASAEDYPRSMLSAWARDPHSLMAVLLRTGMADEEAARLLHSHITTQSAAQIRGHLEGPDADLRAALFSAMMMGIATGRHVLRLPGLEEADLEDVVRAAAPAIRALLVEEDGDAGP